jgi:sodium/proline symporter
MPEQQPIIIATFIVYLIGMLLIGWIAYRRTGSVDDYILGGRKLGPWVTALSAGASDMSGWLLLGLPGYAYLSGLESIWLAAGLLLGTWLNWRFIAARLRCYSEIAGNSLTIPEFLEQRFRDKTHILRFISASFILIFFLFYTSSGLVAGGKLFESVFGLPYEWAVLFGTLTVLIYTSFGGFLAVSWTDVVQGLLMALALILIPLLALYEMGGVANSQQLIEKINPELLNPLTDKTGQSMSALAIASLLGWGLGYFGQPHILARFKAISSTRQIPRARRIAVSWSALTLIGASLVGLTGIGLLDTPLGDADSETILIVMISLLLHPIPAGICFAAILAAIMSTADSQLLVSSSVLTEDFYRGLFRKQATQRQLIAFGRGAVVIIAVIACALAMDPDSKVLDLVAYAWAGFGAAFGPPLMLALYWQRMNFAGALAGILSGGLTVLIWHQLEGGIFELYELIPGFIISLAACYLGSFAGKPPCADILQEFSTMRHKV